MFGPLGNISSYLMLLFIVVDGCALVVVGDHGVSLLVKPATWGVCGYGEVLGDIPLKLGV